MIDLRAALERRTFLKRFLAALTLSTLSSVGLTQAEAVKRLRIGAVLPIPTGNPAVTDVLGISAQAGAQISENIVGNDPAARLAPKVLLASGPTTAATLRAAQRLIAVEEVTALIGGFGLAQADLLRQEAEDAGVLFFNLGTSADAFQNSPGTLRTFHIEASVSAYLEALFTWFARLERRRWFFVSSRSPNDLTLGRTATALLEASPRGIEGVGRAIVGSGIDAYATYPEVLETLRQADPEAVMLFMSPDDGDFFLGQYEYSGLNLPVTRFPAGLTQTREAYTRSLQSAPQTAAGYRAALWEATARMPQAQALNDAFTARTGTLMESSAWAAYAAVKILTDAAQATASSEADVLGGYLESTEAAFEVGKGESVSFNPATHQLRQPLFIVELVAGTTVSTSLKDQLALAHAVARIRE